MSSRSIVSYPGFASRTPESGRPGRQAGHEFKDKLGGGGREGRAVELLCDRREGGKGKAENTGQEVQGTSQPSLLLETFQPVLLNLSDPLNLPRSPFPGGACCWRAACLQLEFKVHVPVVSSGSLCRLDG